MGAPTSTGPRVAGPGAETARPTAAGRPERGGGSKLDALPGKGEDSGRPAPGAPLEPAPASHRREAPASALESARIFVSGIVVSPDGPVRGATVQGLEGRKATAEVQTDARGRFELALPVRGEAVVLVRARGYAPVQRVLPVAAASVSTNRYLGNIRLRRGTLLRGVVRGASGAAVAGAKVTLRPFDAAPERNDYEHAAVSAADGSFEIHDAPAGRVQVQARARGHGETSQTQDLATGPAEIELRLGEERRLAVRLRDGVGAPVVGVAVHLLPTRPTSKTSGERREAISDGEGLALFEGLGQELWTVQVVSDNYRPAAQTAQADGRELELVLSAWPCVTGRVVAPGGEVPPAQTRIQLLPSTGKGDALAVGRRAPEHDADAEGRFRVCGARPGNYVLRASAPGFAPALSHPFRVGHGEVLDTGSIFLRRGARLAVHVRGPEGPVVGARVETHTAPPPTSILHAAAPIGSVLPSRETDGDGRALFENLPPGELWILVRGTDELLGARRGPLLVQGGRLSEPEAVLLERGAHLQGRVTDAKGQGVPGALVLLFQSGPEPVTVHATSAADGSFRTPPLPAGTWNVRVRGGTTTARRPGNRAIEVHLSAGEEQEIELEL